MTTRACGQVHDITTLASAADMLCNRFASGKGSRAVADSQALNCMHIDTVLWIRSRFVSARRRQAETVSESPDRTAARMRSKSGRGEVSDGGDSVGPEDTPQPLPAEVDVDDTSVLAALPSKLVILEAVSE